MSTTTTIILYSLRVLIVLLFVALGWREILLLLSRPGRNMGLGLGRVWAVANTTILEAWASRIWLLPVLWFVCAIILIFSVRPFDESERIPLYIGMLLSSQEILILVMMWVMACVSLPRERERKIMITNVSKPLSRLEIVLGKIVGFSVASALTLAVMFGMSMLILLVSNSNLKTRARQAYELQQRDFQEKIANVGKGSPSVAITPPSEALVQLAEEGSLFAYNPIVVPRQNMSILGYFDATKVPMERWIKGGSYEKATYVFNPRLLAPYNVLELPVGTRPYFEFNFPIQFFGAPPLKIELEVTAYCSQSHRVPPPKPVSKLIELHANGVAVWEPDAPEELYSLFDPRIGDVLEGTDQGEVTVEVTCRTPGVLLQVFDGMDPDGSGKISANANFNVYYHPDPQQPLTFVPRAHPIMRGFERRDRQEISGPKPGEPNVELALYQFPAASLKDVPVDGEGNFTLAVQFETYKAEHPDLPTSANLLIISMDSPNDHYQVPAFSVREKRLTELKIPSKYLGDPDPAKRSDLFIAVRTFSQGHSISLLENSVRIERPRTPFFINLLQSELVILCEAVLLIAVCVMCSIRVGWPIAMLVSGLVFAFGNFIEFILSIQDYGGLGALNYNSPMGNNETLFNVLDKTTHGIWIFLGLISSIVPNFNIYHPDTYISHLQHMPWSILGSNMLDTVVFIIPIIALAYLMFRKQEVG